MGNSRNAATAAMAFVCLAIGCGKVAIDEPNHDQIATGSSSSSSGSPGSPGSSAGTTGSSADASATTPAPVARRTDLQLQALGDATCTRIASCGLSGSAIFTGTWGDQATCVADQADAYSQVLAAKGVTVTQAQIDACVARQALAPCEDDIAECTFAGTEPDGAACGDDSQCASARCSGYGANDCGHCIARVPAGGSCGLDIDCGVGLACNAATHRCMSPLPAGVACQVEDEICGPGLACLNGLCSERLPLGSPCSSASHLVHHGYYDDCAGGSWCNSETLVCTAFRKTGATAELGEPCGDDVSCKGSFCDDTTKRCEARTPTPVPVCF